MKENLYWIVPLIITTIIAIANIVIAIFNYRNSKNLNEMQNDMFCFQLYEKRLNAFESLKEVLSDILANGEAKNTDVTSFLSKTKELKFIFGNDVIQVCDAIHKTIVELHVTSEKIKHNSVMNIIDKNHLDLCDKEAELLKNLTTLSSELTDKVSGYISFDKYKLSK